MAQTTKNTKKTSRRKTGTTSKARKTRTPRARSPRKQKGTVTPEERFRMIQEAAYFLAERDGFRADATAYWLRAEAEIDAQLAGLR